MKLWASHLRWMRTAAARIGAYASRAAAVGGVLLAGFTVSAAVFTAEEHQAARDRFVAVLRIWMAVLPSVDEADTRFYEKVVDGITFMTGITNRPGFQHRWCYALRPHAIGGSDIKVEFGSTISRANNAPSASWNALGDEQARLFNKSTVGLAAAARAGCQLS